MMILNHVRRPGYVFPEIVQLTRPNPGTDEDRFPWVPGIAVAVYWYDLVGPGTDWPEIPKNLVPMGVVIAVTDNEVTVLWSSGDPNDTPRSVFNRLCNA